MRRVKAKTWEDLDALPEAEWVEVVGGLDIEVFDRTTGGLSARVVIPLKPADARRLKPRRGEVLEATLRGRNLELVRRKPGRAARHP